MSQSLHKDSTSHALLSNFLQLEWYIWSCIHEPTNLSYGVKAVTVSSSSLGKTHGCLTWQWFFLAHLGLEVLLKRGPQALQRSVKQLEPFWRRRILVLTGMDIKNWAGHIFVFANELNLLQGIPGVRVSTVSECSQSRNEQKHTKTVPGVTLASTLGLFDGSHPLWSSVPQFTTVVVRFSIWAFGEFMNILMNSGLPGIAEMNFIQNGYILYAYICGHRRCQRHD